MYEHLRIFTNIYFFSICSQDQVPHDDRRQEGVDAGHVLPQREGGQVPQHPRAERLHQDLPERRRAVQHKVRRYNIRNEM